MGHRIFAIGSALLLCGSTPAAADDCAVLPRPDMRVRLSMPAPFEPAGRLIKAIVDDTWRGEGLRFTWAEGPIGKNAWAEVDVWIAVVRDRLAPEGLLAPQGVPVLGQVQFSPDGPLRLIRLSIEGITQWLREGRDAYFRAGTPILHATPGRPARLLPHALGQVAAHELGHFVLGSPDHARWGVMQASFGNPYRLLRPSRYLGLDLANQARLKARLAEGADCP